MVYIATCTVYTCSSDAISDYTHLEPVEDSWAMVSCHESGLLIYVDIVSIVEEGVIKWQLLHSLRNSINIESSDCHIERLLICTDVALPKKSEQALFR